MKKFKIYQLPVEHKAKFMRLSFVQKMNIMPKLEDYNLVWEGVEKDSQGSYAWRIVDWLDAIYMDFNQCHPEGYKGHSLSMSDVVYMDGKYFYCDSFGWEEVFFSPTSIKVERICICEPEPLGF